MAHWYQQTRKSQALVLASGSGLLLLHSTQGRSGPEDFCGLGALPGRGCSTAAQLDPDLQALSRVLSSLAPSHCPHPLTAPTSAHSRCPYVPLIHKPFLPSQQSSGLLKQGTHVRGSCEDKAYPGPSAPAVMQQVSTRVPGEALYHLPSHCIGSRSLPIVAEKQGPQKVTRVRFLPHDGRV